MTERLTYEQIMSVLNECKAEFEAEEVQRQALSAKPADASEIIQQGD